ncbi:MAG: DUF4271 domain-containing protein [Bacteroidales bacterium]|nr:DUF4271 domain-containing protein [Bacteroidales bacterium]
MENPNIDSLVPESPAISDSSGINSSVFVETIPGSSSNNTHGLHSGFLIRTGFPDWLFLLSILILAAIAAARVIYGKFLNSLWSSAFSYQFASKVYQEHGIVQKRFGYGLVLLYLINGALFLYLLNSFFEPGIFVEKGFYIVWQSFLVLSVLIVSRILIMRFAGFVFRRQDLFSGFLHHYFIYNKIIGIVLIPFLFAIPYTQGKLQEIIVFTGITLVLSLLVLRLVRLAFFVLKNVVLFFYLILYLCILEIIPVLVVIKLLLSLGAGLN